MPDSTNKLSQFWQELKRRNVLRLLAIYAGTAYVILEASTIIFPRWGLPDWTIDLVLYLLILGAIITFVISWIYDITPEGVQKTKPVSEVQEGEVPATPNGWKIASYISVVVIVVLIVLNIIPRLNKKEVLEKSIAVLPFINDSSDEENEYFINGTMEAILDNLAQIKDLRVVSRTSVLKYRDNPKPIREIANEMNVSYILEGSGQKDGNKIRLTLQLIDGINDKHLWSSPYTREIELGQIFDLQSEIAQLVATEIESIVTPEEEVRINKAPTNDLVAYDYFLKGLDLLNRRSRETMEEAISYFKKAIEHDNEFARAHAAIAITYYYLDEYQTEKKYSAQINRFADKALLLDSQLPQSLIAKALDYMHNEEYELAIPYFEKALEYNPNSALVYLFMINLYVNYLPDTEKYLEYALKGLQLDISAYDSITRSYSYLHMSNAFIQSGFVDEAEIYINKSLEYAPENFYSAYVKAYILFAKSKDLLYTKELLVEIFNKDTTRLDIIQEVGKLYYFMRDYESAYDYYELFIELEEALNLNIYESENAKIGVVFSKMGLKEEATKYIMLFKDYAETDQSIYKHISLAAYYSINNDTEKAIEHLELFSLQNNYSYWTFLFTEIDPAFDNVKDLPAFKIVLKDIESKFWINHERIKASLEKKNLL